MKKAHKIFFLTLILSLVFLSNNLLGVEAILQKFNIPNMDNWKIVVLELGRIRYGDLKQKKTKAIFDNNIDITYNEPLEKISCPTIYHLSNKLLLAKNYYDKKIGMLVQINLDNREESVLIEDKIIVSPTISKNDQLIAYLIRNTDTELYSLYVYNSASGKAEKTIDRGVKLGGAYNYNISWLPDNQHIFYTNRVGQISMINIISKQINQLTAGYDPLCSPDGNYLIYNKTSSKPYSPILYDLKNNKAIGKITGSQILNTAWTPDGKYILVVKNVSRIFRWNEWERAVELVSIESFKKETLFKYEGFEYIDCK